MGDDVYCANLIAVVVNQFTAANGTAFRGCSYYEGLNKVTTQVDPALLRDVDCKNADCSALWQEFVSNTGNCPILNQETRRSVNISSLANVCSPTTTASPITTTSVAPSSTTQASPSSIVASDPSSSSSSSTATIGIVAGAVVVVVALVVFAWTRRRRHAPSSKQPSDQRGTSQAQDDSYDPHATPTHTYTGGNSSNAYSVNSASMMDSAQQSLMQRSLVDLDMYRIPVEDVVFTKPLAEGAYGEVWLGEVHQERVAIKRLLPSKRTTAVDLQKFISEIVLLSRIDCPYVVRFIGAAWNRPSDIVLVTEYLPCGDLRQVLDANQLDPTYFSWSKKVQCAHHIAEALVYLDFMTPKVIHRDLKSRNVLMDHELRAKLTDFGIARETHDNELTLTAGIGTYRWMAPEVLQDGHYTEKADIFSFGVILAELSTELVPYADLRNAKGNPLTDTAIMAKVMTGDLQPAFSPTCPAWFADLGKQCMALNPDDRPAATMVAFRLQKAVAQLKVATE